MHSRIVRSSVVTVAVARDFYPYPGGRYTHHGQGNGEDFRDRFLLPNLRAGKQVQVVLDDAAGFPASFLEEAFGGLIRNDIALDQVKTLLSIVAEDPENQVYVDEAWQYVEEAAARGRAR